MGALLARILLSKSGLIAIGLMVGLSAMYTWHIIDKTVAVRNAKQALADKVTIATLKSTVETQGKWIKAAEDAKIALIKQAAVAEQAAAEASLELEEYANNTTVNAQCAVDSNLVNRLRNR